ncbi:hypothetical protein F5B20DRAFT_399449 [Whalleya microplaca]|nr:hypothetical protein F5B20DRAFT_399449 [Whalleya microplaca]
MLRIIIPLGAYGAIAVLCVFGAQGGRFGLLIHQRMLIITKQFQAEHRVQTVRMSATMVAIVYQAIDRLYRQQTSWDDHATYSRGGVTCTHLHTLTQT